LQFIRDLFLVNIYLNPVCALLSGSRIMFCTYDTIFTFWASVKVRTSWKHFIPRPSRKYLTAVFCEIFREGTRLHAVKCRSVSILRGRNSRPLRTWPIQEETWVCFAALSPYRFSNRKRTLRVSLPSLNRDFAMQRYSNIAPTDPPQYRT
jgi:hypothetical protein